MVRILGVIAVALAVVGGLIAFDLSTASAQDEGTPVIVAADQDSTVVEVQDAQAVTDNGVPVAEQGVVVDPSVLANAATEPVVVFTVLAGIVASGVTSLLSRPGWSDPTKMMIWIGTSTILGLGYWVVTNWATNPAIITAASIAGVAIIFYRLNPTAMKTIQANYGLK